MMDKKLSEILDWCVNHWAFCAFVLGIVFEVPSWKLKPFTALFRWISKRLVGDLTDKVDAMGKELEAQSERIDRNEMDRIRCEVLDFANSCRNDRKHTKSEFEHIIDINGKYEELLKKYKVTNGVYTADYKFVLQLYQMRLQENDFLC